MSDKCEPTPEQKAALLVLKLDELKNVERMAALALIVKGLVNNMVDSLEPHEALVIIYALATAFEDGAMDAVADMADSASARSQLLAGYFSAAVEVGDAVSEMALNLGALEILNTCCHGNVVVFETDEEPIGFEVITHNAPGSSEVN